MRTPETTFMTGTIRLLLPVLALAAANGQNTPALPPLPAPLDIPKPGPSTSAPYAPMPILQGGVVVPLYPAGLTLPQNGPCHEAEQYNMSNPCRGESAAL